MCLRMERGPHARTNPYLGYSYRFLQGMGEPLLNLPSVVRAFEVLNRDVGIGARSITISTVGEHPGSVPSYRIRHPKLCNALSQPIQITLKVWLRDLVLNRPSNCPDSLKNSKTKTPILTASLSGVPNAITRLAEADVKATLAVSIHAPNQELRKSLIPSAKAYPLEALMEECVRHVAGAAATGNIARLLFCCSLSSRARRSASGAWQGQQQRETWPFIAGIDTA